MVDNFKKLFVVAMIGAVLALGITACNKASEPASGDQPSEKQSSDEHPSGEHPSGDHPSGEHPK